MCTDPEQAAIEVKIDEEASVATVAIPDDFDPALLDATLLAKLAEQRGIAVDSAVKTRLLQIVETFRDEPKRLEQVIARSIPPVHGQDGRIEWMKDLDPTAGPTAAVAPDDSDAVDYYNQISYVRVAEGTHVATLHEPTLGEDGRDVIGRTIKAKPGRKCDVKIASSLAVDESGRVVSQMSGILQHERGVLKINRLFEVRGNIDFATGNIDFDGTVIVREGVRDRFILNATEDIIVDGLIEAATINCGGNFTCKQGMAAKGRGQLVIEGDAIAGYLNDVKGCIKGNLSVRRELINCALVVSGNLICDQGALIGGEMAVGGSVEVAVLGSNAGRPTRLILAEVDVLVHKTIFQAVFMTIGDVEVKFDMALKGPIKIGRDEHHGLYVREGDGPKRPLNTVAKITNRAA